MSIDMDNIHRHCKCCVCEGKLPEIPIFLSLPVKVNWQFPSWGDFIAGRTQMGVAFICEKCEPNVSVEHAKFTVEFKGDQVVYHPLKWDGDKCSLV